MVDINELIDRLIESAIPRFYCRHNHLYVTPILIYAWRKDLSFLTNGEKSDPFSLNPKSAYYLLSKNMIVDFQNDGHGSAYKISPRVKKKFCSLEKEIVDLIKDRVKANTGFFERAVNVDDILYDERKYCIDVPWGMIARHDYDRGVGSYYLEIMERAHHSAAVSIKSLGLKRYNQNSTVNEAISNGHLMLSSNRHFIYITQEGANFALPRIEKLRKDIQTWTSKEEARSVKARERYRERRAQALKYKMELETLCNSNKLRVSLRSDILPEDLALDQKLFDQKYLIRRMSRVYDLNQLSSMLEISTYSIKLILLENEEISPLQKYICEHRVIRDLSIMFQNSIKRKKIIDKPEIVRIERPKITDTWFLEYRNLYDRWLSGDKYWNIARSEGISSHKVKAIIKKIKVYDHKLKVMAAE